MDSQDQSIYRPSIEQVYMLTAISGVLLDLLLLLTLQYSLSGFHLICIPNQTQRTLIYLPSNASQFMLRLYSFVAINTYWDWTSKVIILIVDASLNNYFLRVVKQRLVKNHGLTKYKPLVTYNAPSNDSINPHEHK